MGMKDSGIEWIGKIPEEWNIKIIKNICSLKGRIGWQGLTADEYCDEGAYLITGVDFENGSINWNNCEHVPEFRYKQAPEIQIKNNDLLITKDGTVGKLAIIENCPDKVTLNSGVLLIRPINEGYVEKFLYYVLMSEEFWHWFEVTNLGATTIIHLYQNVFAKFKLVLPSNKEQNLIVDFLNDKTGKIDDILIDLNKQVEILENYKKSLINDKVNNGLTSKIKSQKLKIGRLVNLKQGLAINAQSNHLISEEETSLALLRIADMNAGTKEVFMSEKTPKQYIAHKEDIIYTRTGQVGFVFRNQEGVVHNNCFRVFPKNENQLSRDYLYWVLKSDKFFEYANLLAWGSAQPDLSHSSFKRIEMTLFPLEEQKLIVNYLEQKCAQIDELIKDKKTQIEKMEGYKKSLIYEYVTGKKRVKGVE